MERYSEYKDSGVQWLGEIPEHWECEKIKYIATINDESLSNNEDPETVIKYVEIGDVNFANGITNSTLYKFKDAPSRARRVAKEGDLIISTVRTYLRAIARIYEEGFIVSTGFAVLRPQRIGSAYLSYAISTEYFVGLIQSESVGISYPAININKLIDIKIPFPPLPEQHSIVTYLDSKCSKIDEWINKKQKEVELLGEAKQRIIVDAVTRGLNPNVKMKKTGIAWLYEVPEHWGLKPIRSLMKESEEKTETGDEELLSLSQYTGITRKKDANKTGMFEAESTIGYKKVHPGQFVMNIMLAWNGSYAVSALEGIISPAYCVFDFICDCDKLYYDFLLRTKMYSSAFKTESRGIIDSRLRLYPYKFYPFYILVPPLSEQQAIVSYITAKTTKIDSLMSAMNKEIEHLKEYKQRLISDVVTGQIKVC